MPTAAHPSLAEITALLRRERQHLMAVWATVPSADRERRPHPDAWTPAEVVEHLRLVEDGSARLLAHRLQRAREAGLGAETSATPQAGRMAAHDVVEGTARYEAPEFVRPAAGVRAADAEAGLEASRAALRGLVAAADGLALGEVRARHARFGELDLYQWLEFVALHERRHARQLERLRDALAAEPAGYGVAGQR